MTTRDERMWLKFGGTKADPVDVNAACKREYRRKASPLSLLGLWDFIQGLIVGRWVESLCVSLNYRTPSGP